MLKEFLNNSYLFGGNAPFIEELYEKYLANPQSIPKSGATTSTACRTCRAPDKDVAHAPVVESSFSERSEGVCRGADAPTEPVTPERLQVAALLLVTAYRIAGARWATVDPLKRMPRPNIPELEPAYYDLKEADLDQVVNAGSFVGWKNLAQEPGAGAARHVLPQHRLRVHVHLRPRAAPWIQERIEPVRGAPKVTSAEQKRLLQKLTEAEHLERYLHTRYVGQKRFSLEGGRA